jgi:membrane-associated phospholipid phosphatase
MEERLLLTIHAHASPLLDALFRASHLLGSLPTCALVVLALVAWHAARGERRQALVWLGAGLATLLLLEGIKPLVARARPDLWPRLTTWPTLEGPGSFSFPSGHALASATFYPLLASELARRRPGSKRLAYACAIALAAFIGFGRLYLGVHWPSDVLAGWALGSIQALLAARALRDAVQPAPSR